MLYKKLLFLPGIVGHPSQIIQHNGFQLTLLDAVGSAPLSFSFVAGTALEAVSDFLTPPPSQPHKRSAISTADHLGEGTGLFLHPFRWIFFVLVDLLYHLP